ncbi:MAG: hypothetical protein MMC23_009072 [Stictis urceolatum]|nr:hypothetical protein [Stictis urceolata]
MNSSKSVPTLQVSGTRDLNISQSIAALEYLEEAYPSQTPLLPPTNDTAARAIVRSLANIIACDIQPITNLRVLKKVKKLGGVPDDWSKDFMERGLEAYETLAAPIAGKFSVGDKITLADVCLLPAVWNAQRNGVDLSSFPTVRRVAEALEKEPAVLKAHWKSQPDTLEEFR